MQTELNFWWILIGVSLVTLLPRVLPLVILSRLNLPDSLMRFLQYIPITVMTALLAQAVLSDGESFIAISDNKQLLALLPTLLAAVWTRSLLITVVVGIVTMALLQWL